jgi:L-threonylcarbamoyladenylate synthase
LARCAELGVQGVAAPSANRFGRISPTRATHVADEFAQANEDVLVLDGGPCSVGIESTIVDCTRDAPVLLRPGTLTRERIEAAAGCALRERDDAAPRASGTLASHYAPRATLRLMPTPALRAALEVLPDVKPGAPTLAVYWRTARAPRGLLARQMPADAAAAAQELFAVLREFDAAGVKLIWVEQPPDTAEWEGVRDRLQRAAAPA